MKYEYAVVGQSANRVDFYVKIVGCDAGVQVSHYNEVWV